MVLLPLIYLGIIAATAWAVLWHLKHDAGMIAGNGRSMLATLIVYLVPALGGGVLVLFMVKPLFAKRAGRQTWLPLFEADQPVLFAFIQRICDLTGAPRPKIVEIDCQVNASASFKRGFWSLFLPGDMRLTMACHSPRG